MTATKQVLGDGLYFTSSIKDDVWHPKSNSKAYEWFYFDALSDNGREALVITFFDNLIFSPRYNSNKNDQKTPGLMFCYYRDGKIIFRAINEFNETDLVYSENENICRLDKNSFKFDFAPYGKGFLIEINTTYHKNIRIEAKLEWLFIDFDFETNQTKTSKKTHYWNLVAPRADVTGHIKIFEKTNKLKEINHFRGTGYHDHKFDCRWMPETFSEIQWGRAHFADSTAIYFRSLEFETNAANNKIYIIRNGELRKLDVHFDAHNFSRDFWGINYPNSLRFVSHDNLGLKVRNTKVLDSSFFFMRYLTEMTLTLRDGKPRKAFGIAEHLYPKKLRHRWLDWVINLRIGKNGKGSFLG